MYKIITESHRKKKHVSSLTSHFLLTMDDAHYSYEHDQYDSDADSV